MTDQPLTPDREALIEAARQWLTDTQALADLIDASHLLADGGQQP